MKPSITCRVMATQANSGIPSKSLKNVIPALFLQVNTNAVYWRGFIPVLKGRQWVHHVIPANRARKKTGTATLIRFEPLYLGFRIDQRRFCNFDTIQGWQLLCQFQRTAKTVWLQVGRPQQRIDCRETRTESCADASAKSCNRRRQFGPDGYDSIL